MDLIQIVIIGLISVIVIVMIKKNSPELAVQLSIAAGAVIITLLLDKIMQIIPALEGLSDKFKIDPIYLSTILKVIGINYIGEFAASICRDAGESAIASKIELACKVLILLLAIPVLINIFELISAMITSTL